MPIWSYEQALFLALVEPCLPLRVWQAFKTMKCQFHVGTRSGTGLLVDSSYALESSSGQLWPRAVSQWHKDAEKRL